MKYRITLGILFVSMVFNLILIVNCVVILSQKINSDTSFWYKAGDSFLEEDSVVLVANMCKDSNDKSICVFRKTPINYTKHYSVYIRPNELYINNFKGVCRDIALFRYAVLKNLEVDVEFYLIPGEHIYLLSFENNKTYRIDNSFIQQI